MPETSKRLQEILKKVKEINPDAQIAYIGLYNPFGDVKELEKPGNAVVAAWNDAALAILNNEDKMTLVPTFDLFENHLGSISRQIISIPTDKVMSKLQFGLHRNSRQIHRQKGAEIKWQSNCMIPSYPYRI